MVANLAFIYHGEGSLPIQGFCATIAAALQELIGAIITEAFPSLRNIFVEGLGPSGPFQENHGRQLSDYPIPISVCEKESDMGEKSDAGEDSVRFG